VAPRARARLRPHPGELLASPSRSMARMLRSASRKPLPLPQMLPRREHDALTLLLEHSEMLATVLATLPLTSLGRLLRVSRAVRSAISDTNDDESGTVCRAKPLHAVWRSHWLTIKNFTRANGQGDGGCREVCKSQLMSHELLGLLNRARDYGVKACPPDSHLHALGRPLAILHDDYEEAVRGELVPPSTHAWYERVKTTLFCMNGADVGTRNRHGVSVYHLAAAFGDHDLVGKLIEETAVNVLQCNGWGGFAQAASGSLTSSLLRRETTFAIFLSNGPGRSKQLIADYANGAISLEELRAQGQGVRAIKFFLDRNYEHCRPRLGWRAQYQGGPPVLVDYQVGYEGCKGRPALHIDGCYRFRDG